MMKLLLGTILATAAVPAYAGPILDELTPEGMSWSAASEISSKQGEAYTGVIFERGNWTAEIADLEVSIDGSSASMTMGKGVMAKPSGDETSFDSLSVSFDRYAVTSFLDAIDAQIGAKPTEISPAFCAKIDRPIQLDARALKAKSAGNEFSIDILQSQYDILHPEGDCIVDLKVDISGFTSTDQIGVGVKFAKLSAEVYTPLRADQPVVDTSSDFRANGSVLDLTVSFGGAEQVSIGNISTTSMVDAKSMAGLANSGYYELTGEVIRADADAGKINFGKYSTAEIWNAIRHVNANGSFRIDDAKITGEMARGFTSSELLTQGRDLNFASEYKKSEENIYVSMDFDSTDLLEASLDMVLVMDAVDASTAGTGPAAIMVTMPLSVSSANVALNDMGIGSHVERELGFDAYALIGPMVAGNLGQAKGDMVAMWFDAARNGGASISIAPNPSLSVMQLFTGFMGDWTTFGEMTNATVNAIE
ncbi:hypothetical protein LCGC14_0227930 [marine sediment metagenome]|uniref:Uncharacterized protein n=1 Tax=marine sediment metagenome TaxID=412755 RepID=A0A0F9UFI9_9ZZZZ